MFIKRSQRSIITILTARACISAFGSRGRKIRPVSVNKAPNSELEELTGLMQQSLMKACKVPSTVCCTKYPAVNKRQAAPLTHLSQALVESAPDSLSRILIIQLQHQGTRQAVLQDHLDRHLTFYHLMKNQIAFQTFDLSFFFLIILFKWAWFGFVFCLQVCLCITCMYHMQTWCP